MFRWLQSLPIIFVTSLLALDSYSEEHDMVTWSGIVTPYRGEIELEGLGSVRVTAWDHRSSPPEKLDEVITPESGGDTGIYTLSIPREVPLVWLTYERIEADGCEDPAWGVDGRLKVENSNKPKMLDSVGLVNIDLQTNPADETARGRAVERHTKALRDVAEYREAGGDYECASNTLAHIYEYFSRVEGTTEIEEGEREEIISRLRDLDLDVRPYQ